MKDTTPLMRQKQLEIILSKSDSERAMMGVDMIDTTYYMIMNVIQSQDPSITKGDLIALIFYRYYKKDFPPDVLESIMQQIRQYHEDEENLTTLNHE